MTMQAIAELEVARRMYSNLVDAKQYVRQARRLVPSDTAAATALDLTITILGNDLAAARQEVADIKAHAAEVAE